MESGESPVTLASMTEPSNQDRLLAEILDALKAHHKLYDERTQHLLNMQQEVKKRMVIVSLLLSFLLLIAGGLAALILSGAGR